MKILFNWYGFCDGDYSMSAPLELPFIPPLGSFVDPSGLIKEDEYSSEFERLQPPKREEYGENVDRFEQEKRRTMNAIRRYACMKVSRIDVELRLDGHDVEVMLEYDEEREDQLIREANPELWDE
jgi:hypothetical protein